MSEMEASVHLPMQVTDAHCKRGGVSLEQLLRLGCRLSIQDLSEDKPLVYTGVPCPDPGSPVLLVGCEHGVEGRSLGEQIKLSSSPRQGEAAAQHNVGKNHAVKTY